MKENHIHISDNNIYGLTITGSSLVSDILQIADIKNLGNHPELLIFPDSFNINNDGVEELEILATQNLHLDNQGMPCSVDIITGNILGFVGCNNTSLSIHSRFCRDNNSSADYLLYYLLQKVFALNIVDLTHSLNIKDNILDFLIFLFPHMLNKALALGIYKEYITTNHNDTNIRGRLDISGIIKNNIPFNGKLSYKVRHQSHDNSLTQLIRHTIEFIKKHRFGEMILNNDAITKESMDTIVCSTPSYLQNQRNKIIIKNLKPSVHPYFSEYIPLQKLCLCILRYESLRYGDEKEKIYGIMFDGAWLWEEYLNTLLKEFGIKHPKNKDQKDPIYLFQNPKSAPRYPDFYSHDLVLDAKYKRYENKKVSDISREDLAQLISYMYVFKARNGVLMFPASVSGFSSSGQLGGYEGRVSLIPFFIPTDESDYTVWKTKMKNSEDQFKLEIKKFL